MAAVLFAIAGSVRFTAVTKNCWSIYVDSFGLAYIYAAQAFGYRFNRLEGKLTGLAVYARAHPDRHPCRLNGGYAEHLTCAEPLYYNFLARYKAQT